ncbi:MAG: DUF1294 domain-containing protein [Clostridiales bacterium]|nr:DUF1294 domain-containing protein [Clostridiales bacterium]
MKFLVIYLIVINIITFILYGVDKFSAKSHGPRIRISVLLIFAGIGGSLGALLGMYIFKHKTKKWYFFITVPLMLILHAGIITIYLLNR